MAKKKRGFTKAIIFSCIILCSTASAFYYLKISSPGSFIHYEEFGIDIPGNYSIHGIDVSRYQEKITWKNVSEMNVHGVKVQFAFIKATEGVSSVDRQFKRNWKNIKKTGIYAGAYHFFIATKSGHAQAKHFIKNTELGPGDLPPVLDIEEAYGASKNDIQQRVSDWLTLTERAYKTKPIIYTNLIFYKTYLEGKFDDYPLWIAHYKEKIKPRIHRNWTFWQHNESGRVSGIRAYVDFNVFNGDSIGFQKLLIR
jgi:lysozyme